MATNFWGGQTFATSQQDDNGMFRPIRSGDISDLDMFLEQAIDPYAKAKGIDFSKYVDGVNIAPYGSTYQSGIDQNIGAANSILQRLYADDPSVFRGGQFNPWSSFSDWNARQNQRPGFNEGSSFGDFISGGVEHLGDTASELWAEPGVRQLALTAAGGAYAGSQAAPAAAGEAAAGTAAATGAGESFVGPATGTVLGPGAQASGAVVTPVVGGTAPTIAGIATGSAPFLSTMPTQGVPVQAPAAGGGSSIFGPSGAAAGAAGASILQRLASGAIPAAIGAVGANQQAQAYRDVANQYMAMGAPYRSRLSELYEDPEEWLNSPEVQLPIQQGTNIVARSLSTKGNPYGSGNALQEIHNYATKQMYDRLGQEKDRLAGFGGLSSYSAAAPQATQNSIAAQRGVYDAIGRGAANIFNPPDNTSLVEILRRLQSGGSY